jgi:hypothetical protein
VIADEYPGWKVKLAVYGLAAATGFERIQGREHPATGWSEARSVTWSRLHFRPPLERSKRAAFAPMVGAVEGDLAAHLPRNNPANAQRLVPFAAALSTRTGTSWCAFFCQGSFSMVQRSRESEK